MSRPKRYHLWINKDDKWQLRVQHYDLFRLEGHARLLYSRYSWRIIEVCDFYDLTIREHFV